MKKTLILFAVIQTFTISLMNIAYASAKSLVTPEHHYFVQYKAFVKDQFFDSSFDVVSEGGELLRKNIKKTPYVQEYSVTTDHHGYKTGETTYSTYEEGYALSIKPHFHNGDLMVALTFSDKLLTSIEHAYNVDLPKSTESRYDAKIHIQDGQELEIKEKNASFVIKVTMID